MKPVALILVFMLAAGAAAFVLTKPKGARFSPGDAVPTAAGVENVIVFSRDVLSGSEPDGEAGFDALAALGVKSILSVDAARPDLELAEARGMTYAHVPVKYDGIDGPQRVAIAKALKELPKPIYVHCHHGKHRGPTAAALGLICLGEIGPADGIALMQAAGTSEHYQGLFDDVRSAAKLSPTVIRAAELPPPHEPVVGLAATMVEINQSFKEIRLIADNGWQTPVDHPDIELEHGASRLPDLFRALADELDLPKNAHADAGYRAMMREAGETASTLEAAITSENWTLAEELRKAMAQSCVRCHEAYR